MQLAYYISILFICSAILFCCGVCHIMWCLTIPSYLQKSSNKSVHNSKPFSISEYTNLFPIHSFNQSLPLIEPLKIFYLQKLFANLPWAVIDKRHKIIDIHHESSLYRDPINSTKHTQEYPYLSVEPNWTSPYVVFL